MDILGSQSWDALLENHPRRTNEHTVGSTGVRMVTVLRGIICCLQTLFPELFNSINVQHNEVLPTSSLALWFQLPARDISYLNVREKELKDSKLLNHAPCKALKQSFSDLSTMTFGAGHPCSGRLSTEGGWAACLASTHHVAAALAPQAEKPKKCL